MQLERIRINGLFGRFNYDIALRRPEKITIIHAPNGFGKTALITLVHAFFSRQLWLLFKYKFKSLELHFDNREIVEVRKEGTPNLFPDNVTTAPDAQKKEDAIEVEILLQSPMRQEESFGVKYSQATPPLNRYLSFLQPVRPDEWYDDNIDDIISTKEALSRYSAYVPAQFRASLEVPEWLSAFIGSSDCRLIETQRLLRLGRDDTSLACTRFG